jgi:hypothetical protein
MLDFGQTGQNPVLYQIKNSSAISFMPDQEEYKYTAADSKPHTTYAYVQARRTDSSLMTKLIFFIGSILTVSPL